MTTETARPMTALPEEDRERLWKAFFAGFMSSGEGWNGEYPFEWRGTEENIASVKKHLKSGSLTLQVSLSQIGVIKNKPLR